MQKLIQERIIRTIITPLTDSDRNKLNNRKNEQLLIILFAYLFISGICLFFWNAGSSMNLDNKSFRINFSNSETESFQRTVPYICGSILIVTTFFFIKFLVQSIIPLTRDIRNGKKFLLYFIPEKSKNAELNNYFLTTPLNKNQEVEISQEEFESLSEKTELCLEILPISVHVLRLTNGQKVIRYY